MTVLQFETELMKVIPDVFTVSTHKTTPKEEV